jgi:hypothetical protein
MFPLNLQWGYGVDSRDPGARRNLASEDSALGKGLDEGAVRLDSLELGTIRK